MLYVFELEVGMNILWFIDEIFTHIYLNKTK